jgi:hypothetical protein
MHRYIITIEGPEWQDFEDVELPHLPDANEPIETKYGTCLVTSIEQLPGHDLYDGRIVCRMP